MQLAAGLVMGEAATVGLQHMSLARVRQWVASRRAMEERVNGGGGVGPPLVRACGCGGVVARGS